MDPVHQIQQFNSGRDPQLLAIKYDKLRASDFAFFRGTCHLFYDRLHKKNIFKNFPLVWSCGDLHLENFGSYKGGNGLVYFDINDFDEAALAPAGWDLVRMLTSVLVGTEGLHGDSPRENNLGATFLDAYAASLAAGKPYWVERETATGPVRGLLDGLRERSRVQFLDARTEIKGKRRLIRLDGKKALPVSKVQRASIAKFMSSFAQSQPNPAFFDVQDVARRIAGTGSLGVDRFALLVQGKGSPNGYYLLDLKHSTPSTLAGHLEQKQPLWLSEAHRIVELQQRSQAVPMAFLQSVKVGDAAYVLRGLQPSEDRISFTPPALVLPEVQELLVSMGKIVAWAHLRASGRQGSAITDELIEFGRCKKWQLELLTMSRECAQQVRQDATSFNQAYDQGAFNDH
jgi:uncharacterized protein (DUF2252 family)